MKNLKKIYDFVVIFVFVLAAIGGPHICSISSSMCLE